ncbi:riboflavin synthase [Blastococcus sp. Marseille-P5729]|uniref:riboflavin synthase n=1 Tax=Blastococcus sp. Marseille-P5729 TaxID=2086582 RepID=UPI000D0E3E2C|nr:riboflavin synthase [Blastococcus sp. Marseille-P5729]
MFTGIIEEIGTVSALQQDGDNAVVRIEAPTVVADATHGASIAVDGVCLTVVEHDADGFTADVMGETLSRSTLGELAAGSKVNLERAMQAGGRLAGHIVQGHVDAVGTLIERTAHEKWDVLRFSIPVELARYVVEKGSITISGTSLTVSAVSEPEASEPWLEVSLIPTTLQLTTLGALQVQDRVNLEVDVLAKYVERALAGYQRAEDQSGREK